MKRVGISLLLSLLLLLLHVPVSVLSKDHFQDESLVRAAFVFNVVKFTQWPKSVFNDQNSSLNLCTAGNGGLVPVLELLSGKPVKGRKLAVVSIRPQDEMAHCHLLYVAASEARGYQKYIESVAGKPVLTVSELPGFIASGGMVKLFREEGRIRFIINLQALRDQRLEMSSRLLRLAVIVNKESSP